jgi:hypothetical protein
MELGWRLLRPANGPFRSIFQEEALVQWQRLPESTNKKTTR